MIVTATPGTKPTVEKAWVKPGTHIVAVGADMEGKQELDAALFGGQGRERLRRVVRFARRDARRGHRTRGYPCGDRRDPFGRKAGENAEEITIFDTTGMAIQDNRRPRRSTRKERETSSPTSS